MTLYREPRGFLGLTRIGLDDRQGGKILLGDRGFQRIFADARVRQRPQLTGEQAQRKHEQGNAGRNRQTDPDIDPQQQDQCADESEKHWQQRYQRSYHERADPRHVVAKQGEHFAALTILMPA